MGEYEQLIKVKDRRGTKSTIKDTILDLINNEYQIQDDMLMSLEDKIRKEITREMKNEIREKVIKEMANKESKTS
ncbi:MAG: putative N-acyltransferase [Psychromonas sp.]|jgi:predicted N-acyltransferase